MCTHIYVRGATHKFRISRHLPDAPDFSNELKGEEKKRLAFCFFLRLLFKPKTKRCWAARTSTGIRSQRDVMVDQLTERHLEVGVKVPLPLRRRCCHGDRHDPRVREGTPRATVCSRPCDTCGEKRNKSNAASLRALLPRSNFETNIVQASTNYA